MPRYHSYEGRWFPGKEKVGLINHKTGEPEIYEGPDRAALYELWENKVEYFGEDFRKNPDFLQAIRNQGFKEVEDFLEWIGYDESKTKKQFEKNAEKVTKHELPKKIKRIEKLGGGKDFSGQGLDKFGGFGPEPKG